LTDRVRRLHLTTQLKTCSCKPVWWSYGHLANDLLQSCINYQKIRQCQCCLPLP